MKTADHNEMDVLLRALGRSGSRLPVAQRASESRNHLDADELNSYAEGVASEPERLRYIQHLADCDSCREIAVGLVAAAGRQTSKTEPTRAWSIREKLAAFFSPMVLRYAVPGLVLVGLMGLGLIALRQRPSPEFIAQTHPAQAPTASSEASPSASANETNKPTPTTDRLVAAAKEGVISKNDKVESVPASPSAKVKAPAESESGNKPGQTLAAGQTQPTFAPESGIATAPPPPPRAAETEAMKTAEARKQEEFERQRRREDAETSRDELDYRRNAEPARTAAPGSVRNMGGVATTRQRGPARDAKANTTDEQTRTVAGRVFRKQGATWVDTAYATGRPTVNVARGSEQFRALVADEPGLRSVAAQLEGDVIVVWKNTAYRIH